MIIPAGYSPSLFTAFELVLRENPISTLNQPFLEPLDLAIRKISETRHLLALVVTSSENFDYPKAKSALADLELKIRELARIQSKLESANIKPRQAVIPFR